MSDISLVDPLGRRIVLSDHTWFGHILKGHPDVRMQRRFAENVISNPSEIRLSSSDPDCRLYYGMSAKPGILMVVVADVVRGVVKTAYRTRTMKGIVEWSR